MTVKELIRRLQDFDGDLDVIVCDAYSHITVTEADGATGKADEAGLPLFKSFVYIDANNAVDEPAPGRLTIS